MDSEPNPRFFFNLQKGLPAVDDIKHENLGFFLLVCILSLMHQKKDLPKIPM